MCICICVRSNKKKNLTTYLKGISTVEQNTHNVYPHITL